MPAKPPKPAKITPLKANTVKGSCGEVKARRENGVTDATGDIHAGYAGWTNVEFAFTFTTETSKSTVDRIYCAPTNTYFDDVQECLSNCQASLGAFTGICEPVAVIEVSAKPSVVMTKSIRTYALEWQPSARKKECGKLAAEWHERIARHEGRHVADAEEEFTSLQDRVRTTTKDKTYRGNGTTAEDAEKDAEQKLRRDVEAQIADSYERIKKAGDRFHAEPDGGEILDPVCNGC
jgi:hypothetical protein